MALVRPNGTLGGTLLRGGSVVSNVSHGHTRRTYILLFALLNLMGDECEITDRNQAVPSGGY